MESTYPQLPNDWEGHPKKVFDILNQTLQLPDDPKSVGAKLAQDVISMDEDGESLETIWEVILIIVRHIPPGHPWQESLFKFVSILRQREGRCKDIHGDDHTEEWALWKNLPGLSLAVLEVWHSELPVYNPQAGEKIKLPYDSDYNHEGTGEEMVKRFDQWKNFCSFTIKVLCEDENFPSTFPLWHIRIVLETPEWPGTTQEKRDCQVWAVTEWFIRRSDSLLEIMMAEKGVDEDDARDLATGELCSALPPFSVKRWTFWKKQLAAYIDAQQVSKEVAYRISDALANMDAAEYEL